jgi:nucleoside-diphosphate-sugar epimerase
VAIPFKRVLITGGLGFVGSHLIDRLMLDQVDITVIDNESTNVIPFDFFPGIKVIRDSIDNVDLQSLGSFDAVFHLASILGPYGLLKYAGNIGASIFNDTVKIRDYCVNSRAALIDISTSEIYGHPGLLEENSNKVFPGEHKVRTEYGVGKFLAELAVVNKAKVCDSLKYSIIRPFNITGPRQLPDGGFVLPRFVIAALTDQVITVFGNDQQSRAFTHVQDICDAIFAIVNSGCSNEAWNIGMPENKMTILDMANMVLDDVKSKGINTKSTVAFVDPKTLYGPLFSEVVDKIPYVEKIYSKIGWKAKRGAKEIVSDTVDFYIHRVNSGYYFKVL